MKRGNSQKTTDDHGDLPDAGVTRGVTNLTGRDVDESDLAQGHKKIEDRQHGNPGQNTDWMDYL